MKKIILSAATFIVTLLIFYLIGSFINWEINAGKWPPIDRAIVGLIGTLLSVTFSVLAYNLFDDLKN